MGNSTANVGSGQTLQCVDYCALQFGFCVVGSVEPLRSSNHRMTYIKLFFRKKKSSKTNIEVESCRDYWSHMNQMKLHSRARLR